MDRTEIIKAKRVQKELKEKRPVMPEPRTFDNFPEDKVCPVCKTNFNGKTVLIGIDNTKEGNNVEATPVHLLCAVASNHNRDCNLLYTKLEETHVK